MEFPIATVKPRHWWWPPDRKKAKLMTIIVNSEQIKMNFEARFKEEWTRYWLYGTLPQHTKFGKDTDNVIALNNERDTISNTQQGAE